jgi:adenylate cyclase
MAVEIERKFRLAEAPQWLRDHPCERIEQGYVTTHADDVEVRVRLRGSTPLLTVKHGSGERRIETELELSQDQFRELFPLTEGRRIVKSRYRIPLDGLVAEIDVFEGDHKGLVLGEIEFGSEAESAAFDPPDWLGDEVTGEERFANANLAMHGPPELSR